MKNKKYNEAQIINGVQSYLDDISYRHAYSQYITMEDN